jgi:hypothetical protein
MLQKYILLLRNKSDSTKLYGGTSPQIFLKISPLLKFQNFKKFFREFFGGPFLGAMPPFGGLKSLGNSLVAWGLTPYSDVSTTFPDSFFPVSCFIYIRV